MEPTEKALAEDIWRATQSSLTELVHWMAWAATSTLQETRTFAIQAEVQWAANVAYHFTIVQGGEVIGGVGLEIRGPLEGLGELGYWVRSDRCGRGFATESAASVVEFAFGDLDLHRIELRAGVGNRASQRVAEKLGFRREGTLRQASGRPEAPYDCYLYGLLASDSRPDTGSESKP